MTNDLIRKRTTVLAVDDVPGNLIALEAVLSADYNLVLAHSGAEAIALLTHRRDIDVILMDIQMPRMDGYETATRIKQIDHCRDIPIIFITAIYREEPFIRRGYEVGGIDYFSKPFDPEILKRKLSIYGSFNQRAAVLKEREKQLRDSEEVLKAGRKLSSVLEGLPVGVLISDVDGRICQTNVAVSRILRTDSPDEPASYGAILGWWTPDGHLREEAQNPLYRAIHDGIDTHSELLRIRCLDGSEKMILGSVSPLRALDGHIVGAVIVIQDMTERKQIELDFETRITGLVSLGVELEESMHHNGEQA